ECATQITHIINSGIAVAAALLIGANDLVVVLLEVPVVDQRHQHFQTLKLSRARERICVPRPQPFFLVAVVSPLQSNVPNIKPSASLDVRAFYKIILVYVITGCPNQPNSRRFRSGLSAELHRPFTTLVIDDVNFLGCTSFGAFLKGELA